MTPNCPCCELKPCFVSDCRTVVRFGHFRRTSDSKKIQRFRCLTCRKTFSRATHHPCFRQKKRHKNRRIFELLGSSVSMRRTARLLRIHRKTVARRLVFLGEKCRLELAISNACSPRANSVQFDDMETFEHTKCKPISVTLAVLDPSRRILGFQVSQMPAKGRLAKISLKKYGPREDKRSQGRRALFDEIKPFVAEGAVIRSDSNPHYPSDVKEFFPTCTHQAVLGARGSTTGQGELKKIRFDPLFSLNHTCAMYRANVCRLIRKTWCTTKKIERLADHLAIYAVYHNRHLNPA